MLEGEALGASADPKSLVAELQDVAFLQFVFVVVVGRFAAVLCSKLAHMGNPITTLLGLVGGTAIALISWQQRAGAKSIIPQAWLEWVPRQQFAALVFASAGH